MVKVYTVAAPDEWKIRTALERELAQSEIIKLIPRNYSPEGIYEEQYIEKLTLADVIVVIFTQQLKEREDLKLVLDFFKTNSISKSIIPISCKGDLTQQDFLEPLNTLVGIQMDPENQDSLTNTARKIETVALRQNQKKFSEEIAENIDSKSDEYIEPTLTSLRKKGNTLQWIAYFCYLIGFIAILTAGYYVYRLTEDSISTTETWRIVYISIRSFLIVIISIAASRYCFVVGKSFMNEALKNSNRHHAISFGKFYLLVYKKQIDQKELKEIFKDWNIEGTSAFAESTPDEFDPKLFEKAFKIISIAKNYTK